MQSGTTVIVWYLDLQLHMKSMHITTNVVSSNTAHGGVYSIQHYVKKFVSDLQQVTGFLPGTPVNPNTIRSRWCLIAYAVVNPTTIRSRSQRPLWVLCICNTVDVLFVYGEYFYFAFHFILFFSHSVKLTSGFQISTNYDKILLKLAALSIALARLDTIFPVVREITRIKTDNFRIK
jgi:hypothetical protein